MNLKFWSVTTLSMLAAFTGCAAYAASTSPSTTVGSLAPASHLWQQHFSDCVEGSAAAIIGSLTGTTPSETDITALAASETDPVSGLPSYTPTGGTQVYAIPGLFFDYGLVAAVETGVTLAELETQLKHGYRALATVDSGALWSDSGMNPGAAPTLQADHAVVVMTIDPVRDQVKIADPGYGVTETVSTAQFLTMWGPGSNTVVLVSR